MRLAKVIVLFSTVTVKICWARLIIDVPESDKSSLIDASLDILESCYTHRMGTVGVAGSSIGSIMKRISLRDTVIPVATIDQISRTVNHEPIERGSRYKLQVFVVTVTNRTNLTTTLTQIKNEKWWNHVALTVLIDLLDKEIDCSNAHEVLWQAWIMNLLNSIFMCHNRTRGILIYTFNPYTSKAPYPWRQENTYKGINGHPWTLFVREYRDNGSQCDGQEFDKTLDLGGYEVRASIKGMENWWYANSNKKPNILNRIKNITARVLLDSLNVTWKLLLHPEDDLPPRDKNGKPTDAAADVVNGRSDICFNMVYQQVWIKYDITYPHSYWSVAVITEYRGHKSQLDKLISVLDISSRYGVLVVLMITLLFFKFYVRKSLILSILNVVRIICNTAFWKIPNNLAAQIFLGSLFVLVVTIQGIYQGQLAALLTKQVRLPTIDSIDDLAKSDHTIYGIDVWRSYFNGDAFDERYVTTRNKNCTSYVIGDFKAACVSDQFRAIGEAVKFNLHLSRKSMGLANGIYLIRPDWPLEERTNEIYGRAIASDIMRPLYLRELGSAVNKLESYEREDRDQTFKPLTLNQLGFAFVILAIGLTCATVIFVIEVTIDVTTIANLRNRIRRRIAWILPP